MFMLCLKILESLCAFLYALLRFLDAKKKWLCTNYHLFAMEDWDKITCSQKANIDACMICSSFMSGFMKMVLKN